MADELRKLAADLSKVATGVRPFAEKAIEVTARNIKSGWAERAEVSREGTGFAGAYSSSIDYDMRATLTSVEADIGPNLGKRGGSAGFLEDAPGGVKSRPQHAGRDALEANEQDFYDGLAKAAADALLEGLGL